MNEKIAAIQKLLGVAADGAWGPKSQAALDSAKSDSAILPPKPDQNDSTGSAGTQEALVDSRSEANIATLHHRVRPVARDFIKRLSENGITAKVISGARSYEEQDELYAQGRTKPGPIVTNARGGQSSHNFSTAFDIGIFVDGRYLDDSPFYEAAGALGLRRGLSWGGLWSKPDYPHFYLKPAWALNMDESQMMAELRRRHDNGIDAFA